MKTLCGHGVRDLDGGSPYRNDGWSGRFAAGRVVQDEREEKCVDVWLQVEETSVRVAVEESSD